MAKRKRTGKRRTRLSSNMLLVLLALVILIIIGALCYGYFGLHKTPYETFEYFMSFVKPADKTPDNGGGFNGETSTFDETTIKTVSEGDFSVHFLELGNKNTGDCIYIRAGENDILIDAGSKTNSIPTIKNYLNEYVTDNKLEYVIATHAHEDHIAGFSGSATDPSIFRSFVCETIIDFPLTESKTSLYTRYVSERDAEVDAGAKHYTALDCYENKGDAKRTYTLGDNTTMSVLYNYYYEHDASTENDYSVCLLFTHDDKNYLFTGDLEAKGESYLTEYNVLPVCELYKAGHHGSKTSSSDALLNVIKPKIVCVCCCAGNDEYTKTEANQFPTQEFIDRISPYTDAVYVTSMGDVNFMPDADVARKFSSFNGTIIVLENTGAESKLFFSNNSTKLKDSAWFKAKRVCPTAWAA